MALSELDRKAMEAVRQRSPDAAEQLLRMIERKRIGFRQREQDAVEGDGSDTELEIPVYISEEDIQGPPPPPPEKVPPSAVSDPRDDPKIKQKKQIGKIEFKQRKRRILRGGR